MAKIELSEHFDYKKLLKFTIPSILMMVFTSIFSVIDDGLFVSNFVGKDAFVAINIMAPILTAVGAIAFMISTGSSAIVAKTLGEKENQKANEYFSMIVYFSIFIGIIITILGYIVLEPFCIMLGAKRRSVNKLYNLWKNHITICNIIFIASSISNISYNK